MHVLPASTLLPHAPQHRRERAPTIMWMVIPDNDTVGDLPMVALPSSSEGTGSPAPPDAAGCPGLVRALFTFNGMWE